MDNALDFLDDVLNSESSNADLTGIHKLRICQIEQLEDGSIKVYFTNDTIESVVKDGLNIYLGAKYLKSFTKKAVALFKGVTGKTEREEIIEGIFKDSQIDFNKFNIQLLNQQLVGYIYKARSSYNGKVYSNVYDGMYLPESEFGNKDKMDALTQRFMSYAEYMRDEQGKFIGPYLKDDPAASAPDEQPADVGGFDGVDDDLDF